MSKLRLAVGDIVTDIDEESAYEEMQGQITEVKPDGAMVVTYPAYMIPLVALMPGDKPAPREIDYAADELHMLRKDEQWAQGPLTEHQAKALFGEYGYHTCYAIPTPFELGGPCQLEDCLEAAVRRCLINVAGTVCPVDLCEPHGKEWHGMGADILPALKSAPEAEG